MKTAIEDIKKINEQIRSLERQREVLKQEINKDLGDAGLRLADWEE